MTTNSNQENNIPEKQASFLAKNKKTLIGVVLIITVIISAIVILFQNENIQIHNNNYIFGIDISHYQGTINWNKVSRSKHPIKFVIARATVGTGKDKQYQRNWQEIKNKGYIRGAYHYYRHNEDATLQFNNFARSVILKSGDLPPVLDIENKGSLSNQKLRKAVLTWLKLAEEKYGVKPIVYTGRNFYNQHLKGYIDDYPLWIASYSSKDKLKNIDWTFHQYCLLQK